MLQTAPDDLALLKHQQLLPDELRQSCVMLVFGEPVCSAMLNEFLLIQLTDLMHDSGEDGFYMVNRVQPERMGGKRCPKCKTAMQQMSLNEFVCTNRRCDIAGTDGLVAGPRRGILGIKIAPEFVTRAEGRLEYVDKAVLVLDRRYPPKVLTGILRTAHAIAEERGWQLK